jgi:CRP/FNR family cyclic AMP-dependent transcriptional regulator
VRLHKNAKVDAMAKVPLFAQCSRRDLERIARLADEIDFPEGKTLIKQGDRGREFFVILEGEVDVQRGNRRIASRGAGEFIGEIALVSDVPRTATVTVAKPMRALVITDRAFRQLLTEAPEIQAKVMKALADRLGTVVDDC